MKGVRFGLAAIVAAAVVLGAVALPQRAQGARTATVVTIGASETTARVYRSLTLRGRLRTKSGRPLWGRTLRLESRPANGTVWSLVAKTKTNSVGRVYKAVRPRADTYYRFRYRGSPSYRPDTSKAKKIVGHRFALKFWEPFSGSLLSTATWTPSMQWGNHTTDLLQVYSPKALKVENNRLIVTATKRVPTADDSSPYQSGVVSAHGSGQFNFKYGYTETRVRVPKGMGLWSAVWLLPKDPAASYEMDVVEVRGQEPRKNHMTLHFNKDQVKTTYDGPDMSAGFHTFGLNWTKDYVAWYWDGVERYRVSDPAKIPDLYMYPLANLQMGSWGGTPTSSTPFPAHFYVEYIKVYQRQ